MGVRILDEDGAILFEFANGLGKPLLSRLLREAKFSAAHPDIVLNQHVASLGRAIEAAMPRRVHHAIFPQNPDDTLADHLFPELFRVLRGAILDGGIPWLAWSDEQREGFLKDELYAPAILSGEKAREMAETITYDVNQWRQTLANQTQV